ncbi:NUDIX domain-containing protein [Helicobacter sp. faydin-H10]|nr:NUDIX domain-containing protein [Helicobacter anatolicus]MCE3039631.1 NUDIX domain-containing protein [Helicobacter anatolicus]
MKYFPPPKKRVDFASISCTSMQDSKYIKPLRLKYTENGIPKQWDIIKSMDSVCILLFDISKEAFVLVRQFRPAVFYNSQKDGYTYELCAGLVDKEGKSLEEIAREEVLEECGYDISLQELQKIGEFLNATGANGNVQHLYFAQVSDKNKVNQGGGIDDECLEVLYLPKNLALNFIFDQEIPKTTSLFLGIQWYFYSFKDRE